MDEEVDDYGVPMFRTRLGRVPDYEG